MEIKGTLRTDTKAIHPTDIGVYRPMANNGCLMALKGIVAMVPNPMFRALLDSRRLVDKAST
jgi:hypothetical protein